ncbi:MAG TPA: hypothetical protein VG737_01430 [Cyclobacteriaceae bacterium]|nr:hypothetical protein [Cyclobacteriaceae bacterium]
MDHEKEKDKLKALLEIPISEVRFSNFFCEVYYRDCLIGYLPITVSSAGIQYEKIEVNVRKLDWPKLCNLNALELTSAVSSHLGRRAFKIVPTSFRRLFIEDGQSRMFASFQCRFRNNSWEVSDEGILRLENDPDPRYQRETTSSASPNESVIPAPPSPFTI